MKTKFIVRQQDAKDCGVCCLESIIKYYGGFVPLERLRAETRTDINGTTAYHLIKTAKKYGFTALGKKNVKLDDKNLILPAIAYVITDQGMNHFVVIYRISKNYVTIMDPAKGLKTIKKEEFTKIWTNIVLLFKPFKKIPYFELKYKLKDLFMDILIKERKLIFKTIFITFIITVLSLISSYFLKIAIYSIENSYLNTTLFIIFIYFFVYIFKVYFEYIRTDLTIYLNKDIDLLLIPEFISHIVNLPLDIINSRTSGEILTRVRDLNNIKDLFSDIFITIILDLFLTISSIYLLYSINSHLFFILCIVAILYIIVGLLTNPMINKMINDNIDLETEFNKTVSEKISSLESIKNLCLTNVTNSILEEKYCAYEENTFFHTKQLNFFLTIKQSINEIGVFILTSIGLYLISQNKLSLISLITFTSLLSYFIDPIKNTIDLLPKFSLINLSFDRITEYINLEEETLGTKVPFKTGDIVFKNITYSYDDINNILDNISLTIPQNSHVIIKGHTGCGKSTLIKMINRTINDYQGNITIADINIKDYSLITLRSNILYVSQREKIFNDTILNNIVLNHHISQKELNKVLKITKVDEIINKKSLRLESILYDEGYNLSGGERQRIILARSILRHPKILLLDESLSEIDRVSEKEILKSLDEYLTDTTIIYISHTNTDYFNTVIEMGDIKC